MRSRHNFYDIYIYRELSDLEFAKIRLDCFINHAIVSLLHRPAPTSIPKESQRFR